MRTLRRFLRRVSSWTTTQTDEQQLRTEIEHHLALQIDENTQAGLSPAEARRRALLKFGTVEAIKEGYRDQKGLPSLEALIQDMRLALRRLRMAPAFTISTVLTLALAIGATTSIFTLVHAVLLKSLPVANPEELYRLGKESRCCYLYGYSQSEEFSLVSYDLYRYLKNNIKGFSELAAFPAYESLFGVRRSGSAETAQSYPGEFVSGNYFATFGIKAYAGRMLTPDDDRAGARPTVVMSYRLWKQRYGSDASVIGSVFNIDDKPFALVGIAPSGFYGDSLRPTPPDFFLPLNTEPYVQADADLKKYDTHWLNLIGRIQPGAAPVSVEAEMRVALKQWLRSHWNEMSANDRARFPNQTMYLSPGGAGITSMRQRYQHWLQILMLVSGFVVLIVCANVANLMLVRGLDRRQQICLSMALGARKSRVIRQPLIESMVLSLFGGAAGLAIAFGGTRVILRLAFPSTPGLAGVPIDASPSIPVLFFAFFTALFTGLASGITPAWIATRAEPIDALRGMGRSSFRSASLPRKALVVLQAALSLVLLSAAGLLTTALHSLENQNFGFDEDRRIVANINPRLAGYRTNQLPVLYRRIRNSLESTPGVASVALCLYSPMANGGWGSGVSVDGHPPSAPGDEIFASWDRVTPEYFGVIGNPIVRGRAISEQDTAATRKVAVINEAFARKFFKNEDPIGKHFGRDPATSREFEVVGIAKDARYRTVDLDRPIEPLFFLPEAQAEYTRSNTGALFLEDVVILTAPGVILSNARILQALASVDPNMPVISIRPLREQVAGRFTQQRLIARLTSFFGVLALVLASIGIYGASAYNAGRRITEIGVRIALGADRSHIVRLLLQGALALIVLGLVIGLPLTFAMGRFLGSQLYGMNPYNPAVTLEAALVLGLSALIASFIPAFRASFISPLESLRAE
jgi:predicted permease